MNTFVVSAGRAAANIVDGTIDLSRKTVTETSSAGSSVPSTTKQGHGSSD